MIRETWAEARKNQIKILSKEELPEGDYSVVIDSLKFFEAKDNLHECLSIRFQINSGSYINRKFTINQYFTNKKVILVWRSEIKKIIPNAYDMDFDSVLEHFQTMSKKKIILRIGVSYNTNGNGKKYLNVKYLNVEAETTHKPVKVDETKDPEPF